MKATPRKRGGGRPRKFTEESRPVTVTLPERTLHQLGSIHPDRARAIVKATAAVYGSGPGARKPVEVIEVSPGQGLIVVAPSRWLKKISWLHMVEIAPVRYLLVLPSGTAIEALEMALIDLIESMPGKETQERELLDRLRSLISRMRRGGRTSKAELLFVSSER